MLRLLTTLALLTAPVIRPAQAQTDTVAPVSQASVSRHELHQQLQTLQDHWTRALGLQLRLTPPQENPQRPLWLQHFEGPQWPDFRDQDAAVQRQELLWLVVRRLEALDQHYGYSPRQIGSPRDAGYSPQHWAASSLARALYDYQCWPAAADWERPVTPAETETLLKWAADYGLQRHTQLYPPGADFQVQAVVPDPNPPQAPRPLHFPRQLGLRILGNEYAESYTPDGLDILGSATAFGIQADYSHESWVLNAAYTRQSGEILRRFEPPPASGVLRVYQLAEVGLGWSIPLLNNQWLVAPGVGYMYQDLRNLVSSGSKEDFLELNHARHGIGPQLASRIRLYEDYVFLQGKALWYPLMWAMHSPVREGFPTQMQSFGGELALQANLDFPVRLQLSYQFLLSTDFKDYRQLHSGLSLGALYFW